MTGKKISLVLFFVILLFAGNLGRQNSINASTAEYPMTTSKFVILSETEEELPAAIPGEQFVLQFWLNASSAQKYTTILELREKDGVTVEIFVRESSLLGGQSEKIRFTWTPPKLGEYDSIVHVISSMESPELLSHTLRTSVIVVGSQSELDLTKSEIPAAPPVTEEADETPLQPAGYTFMVYMVASDLESTGYYATEDIMEMMSVGSTENVNVIVQTGGSDNSTIDDIRFIDFTKVQRHQILKGDVKLITDLGTRNMASSSTLGDFVSWGVREYPADKYAIILWDHGAGMIGFGYDDIYDDILDLSELHDGLYPIVLQGKQFEVIGFDACLMASVEVANSLNGRGKYLVASEELEPAWGFDFEAILLSIDSNPHQDGKELGKVISDSYLVHARENSKLFQDYNVDKALTMSVIDLEKIPALVKEVASVGDYLYRLEGDMEITHTLTKTIRETERYGETGKSSTGHLDLYHLAENIDKEFPQAYGIGLKIRDLVEDSVVYKVGGDAKEDSHGISIFMQVEEYQANAPYLKHIVGKWIGVLTQARQSLERDSSPPEISLTMRKDKTLFGKIEGIDLDYVSIFVTREVEENRYQLKILSIVDEEASDFVRPNSLGFTSYNWSRTIMSLCNGGSEDCKPTSVTYEKNGRTEYAYISVRLESDRFNGTLWLIYIVNENDKFEFLGGWPGVDENGNAPRELVPIVEGDRVYVTSFLIRFNPNDDESSFENVEDPDPIIVADGFGPAMYRYPGDYDLLFSACDFSANCAYTDYFPYSVD